MPTQSLRPKQAQPNARQQLKVQQLLIPEIERLQQQELQAQRKLGINKQINQIPKTQSKTKPKTNHLQPPYKRTIAKAAPKPPVESETRALTFGNTTIELPREQHKLEALKQEALEYWRNLPEFT